MGVPSVSKLYLQLDASNLEHPPAAVDGGSLDGGKEWITVVPTSSMKEMVTFHPKLKGPVRLKK